MGYDAAVRLERDVEPFGPSQVATALGHQLQLVRVRVRGRWEAGVVRDGAAPVAAHVVAVRWAGLVLRETALQGSCGDCPGSEPSCQCGCRRWTGDARCRVGGGFD